ncbi:MAG: adenylate kinase [Gemmatimonadales bacterium]|nr:MAG: adenylate kinase [Gemmatimonadales bacterium]
MVLILLGPPGVGKGTQGALLCEERDWTRIATGDLLRAARREESELGRKAQEYMDAGNLVPDELIVAMVRERLEALPDDAGVVFDGFPRTLAQAEALERVLEETGRALDGVLLFEAPDEVLVRRISGRRHAPGSGRVYNVHFDPPETDGVCDETGEPLVHRSDDRPETVRHRLEVYRSSTAPLVQHYEEGPVPLVRIDGDRDMKSVKRSMLHAVEHLESDG